MIAINKTNLLIGKLVLTIIIATLSINFCYSQSKREFFSSDSLSTYIKKSIKYWNVKNCGIVVVKDGKTILKKGFSSKTFFKFKNNTQFPLASVSKHFTSLALLKILKEKNIALDEKIYKYVKNKSVKKSSIISDLSFKDLLNHNTKLTKNEGDFLLLESDFDNNEILEKVYTIQSNRGKSYAYHNTGYVLAGTLIENLTGLKYNDYISEKFFKVIGMQSTITSFDDYSSSLNKVQPYYGKIDESIKTTNTNSDNFTSTGGIYSTLDDMELWIKYLLKNKEIVERNKDTVFRQKGVNPYHYVSDVFYQLGLMTQVYSHKRIFSHYGGLPGITTAFHVIPNTNSGFFLVCNKDNSYLPLLISLEILDAMLELPYRNYTTAFKGYYRDLEQKKDTLNSRANTTQKLNTLIGTYINDIYGEMYMKNEDNNILLSFEHHPNLTAKLSYKEENKLIFKSNSLMLPKVLIELTNSDKSLSISFFSSDPHKYVFKKK